MSSPRKGRRRRISEAEQELWERVAATAEPLRKDTLPQRLVPVPSGKRPDGPAPVASLPVSRPAPQPQMRGSATVLRTPGVGPVGLPEPGLDRRTAERIRKGARVPEARLDLHGMTADRAHAKCLRFVADSLARGLRLVLVITGKGRSSDQDRYFEPRRGVLREQLPGWLAASPLGREIVGIYQAHQKHGGAGAFYIYLRRRRQD